MGGGRLKELGGSMSNPFEKTKPKKKTPKVV